MIGAVLVRFGAVLESPNLTRKKFSASLAVSFWKFCVSEYHSAKIQQTAVFLLFSEKLPR